MTHSIERIEGSYHGFPTVRFAMADQKHDLQGGGEQKDVHRGASTVKKLEKAIGQAVVPDKKDTSSDI